MTTNPTLSASQTEEKTKERNTCEQCNKVRLRYDSADICMLKVNSKNI